MKKFLFILLLSAVVSVRASAQNKSNYIRIANLIIDSSKIDQYNLALKKHAEIAVKVEPGVLMLYAVHEKNRPAHIKCSG